METLNFEIGDRKISEMGTDLTTIPGSAASYVR